MTNVDQFESVFRSAAKDVFAYQEIQIGSILIVTDLAPYEADRLAGRIRSFLQALDLNEGAAWRVVSGSEFTTVRELLDLVEQARPDLICTYRHLHSEGWKWPFTLGDHVAVLTQATEAPVLLVPHPQETSAAGDALENTDVVMAITGDLAGDDRLVNFAARFTLADGRLLLTHVEDERTFQRYLAVIGKIDTIDTEEARQRIERQLLKEPEDFINSCAEALGEAGLSFTVETIVTMGHHLRQYEALVTEHHVDLLVMNTKDEDQMAMHGRAYPLAVQLRHVPLLML